MHRFAIIVNSHRQTMGMACGRRDAVVLASMGTYGVMSDSVNQTTPGVRREPALGAHRDRILTAVLRQGSSR
jgi:hypothetical protein